MSHIMSEWRFDEEERPRHHTLLHTWHLYDSVIPVTHIPKHTCRNPFYNSVHTHTHKILSHTHTDKDRHIMTDPLKTHIP